MSHWLLKTEPGCYSIDDLRKDGRASWGGVRNFQARNFLRAMKEGDTCLFYHSNASPAAAVGVCRVVREHYGDPTQFDPKDDHYDADSIPTDPRWAAVDVAYVSTFAHPVSIQDMRNNERLWGMKLLEKGSRLSVLPVTAAEFAEVVRLGA